MTEPTPKEQAMIVLHEALSEGDGASLEAIAAALDEAGLLIDPVDRGMWENLKLGYFKCQYVDGELQFQMTDMGKTYVEQMLIPDLTSDDDEKEES